MLHLRNILCLLQWGLDIDLAYNNLGHNQKNMMNMNWMHDLKTTKFNSNLGSIKNYGYFNYKGIKSKPLTIGELATTFVKTM
jgi:hypothetical protein